MAPGPIKNDQGRVLGEYVGLSFYTLGQRQGLGGAKTRYRQADAARTLAACNASQCDLHIEQAQWAVTPGQSAVLYQGEVCLGGGVIHGSNVRNGAA